MSNLLWKEKWKRNDIGFHQAVSHHLLRRFLSQLNLPANEKILVPLCGKSHDMDLLADLGYRVMGVELSRIAIKAYFESRQVKPSREKRGRFIIWRASNIEIWCGDVFDLTANDLHGIRTLYDCTSLTAFAAELRPRYIEHFQQTLAQPTQILLMTTESADEAVSNSALMVDAEIAALYQAHYQVELLYGQHSLLYDPEDPSAPKSMMDEKVYLMSSHTSG
ncbi:MULTISPECIES: thiopurine S-methyltransferase [Corallincola]|nr:MULTISPECIES: thiopurine S-methyltransferase [Corallincola]